ncbi:hypothetical protein CPB86DRAFT_798867 [Serendipita vermifera]|nr:hypothetical protein CPB86DRAFT_798867 [Serendipita vermifera]
MKLRREEKPKNESRLASLWRNQVRGKEGGVKWGSAGKANTQPWSQRILRWDQRRTLRWKRQGARAIQASHDGYTGAISRSQRTQAIAGEQQQRTRLAEKKKNIDNREVLVEIKVVCDQMGEKWPREDEMHIGPTSCRAAWHIAAGDSYMTE